MTVLRNQATVFKSSPAPRDNSFDCSLNRHEITVYYYTSLSFFLDKNMTVVFKNIAYEKYIL
jgi:hypothetical protein